MHKCTPWPCVLQKKNLGIPEAIHPDPELEGHVQSQNKSILPESCFY